LSLFEQSLSHAFWINKPSDVTNKFKVLQIANSVAIKTPSTIITNSKDYLTKFLSENSESITKSCHNGGSFEFGEEFISGLTTRVTKNDINYCAHSIFFPSLFQGEIEKAYEIRVFYLEEQIYSVAIFSQISKTTEIDYRNYDYSKPNRMEIVSLPNILRLKIIRLMKKLKMNCGSLDFIKSKYNEYYFLEVNSVGQFLGISELGNLQLDKLIAETLIKNDKK